VLGSILVIISVSTTVSIVLCDVSVVDELVGFAVTVPDVSIAVAISVAIEYKVKNRVRLVFLFERKTKLSRYRRILFMVMKLSWVISNLLR
jgi:hypothetical protein